MRKWRLTLSFPLGTQANGLSKKFHITKLMKRISIPSPSSCCSGPQTFHAEAIARYTLPIKDPHLCCTASGYCGADDRSNLWREIMQDHTRFGGKTERTKLSLLLLLALLVLSLSSWTVAQPGGASI